MVNIQNLDSFILSTSIKPAPRTDHAAICVNLKTSTCERGNGFWKLNIKVLDSEMFDNTFRSFWQTLKKEITKFRNAKQWWETTKVKIREIGMEVAKKLSKQKHIKMSKVEKMLDIAKKQCACKYTGG